MALDPNMRTSPNRKKADATLERDARSIFYRGTHEETYRVNDNVIKFRKPQPPKKPRPGQNKLLAVIIGGVALCALIWVHFQYGV